MKHGIFRKKIWNDLNCYILDAVCKHYLIAMDQNSTRKKNNFFDYTSVFRMRVLISFYLVPCSHNIKKKEERKIKKRKEEGHPSPCHPHQIQVTISLPYESHLGKPSHWPFKFKLDFGLQILQCVLSKLFEPFLETHRGLKGHNQKCPSWTSSWVCSDRPSLFTGSFQSNTPVALHLCGC